MYRVYHIAQDESHPLIFYLSVRGPICKYIFIYLGSEADGAIVQFAVAIATKNFILLSVCLNTFEISSSLVSSLIKVGHDYRH